ncbi:MAG TPA: TPM domain-containing protein [Phycisphaerae bacterium]|nr:TPM domain-containing protein [Phycisphaerae bacterium]HOL25346.1 TPM domain-containing protein [Phycisphaerae bacterium]HPU34871.1 TPM domain-containing protein [Phycisphaerae bacterium]HXK88000.1 TPM domain-containing protein [Phycisphaerae bacterium]
METQIPLRPAILIALLLPSAAALALQPRVKDDAGFFKPETVRRADQHINRIKQEYGRDFIVETFPEIPASLRDELARMSREQFYQRWAGERVKKLDLSGVYVLIVKNPEHLQTSWSRGNRQAISDAQGRELNNLLLKGFRQRQFDAALLDAIQLFESQVQSQPAHGSGAGAGAGTARPGTPAAPEPKGPSPVLPGGKGTVRSCGAGTWICLGIAALAVFMLVRGLGRARRAFGGGRGGFSGTSMGGAEGGGYGGSGWSGGGGGFGRGILGGLLGGILGGWATDRYMGRRGQERDTTGGQAGGPPESGSDFGTAGGDFGGPPPDQGGGDFGTAGGDFGAEADSGGGTDFAGGEPGSGDFGGTGDDFS